MKKITLLTVIQLLFCFASLQATVHYVKVNGLGTGTSWTDAAGNIQDLIDKAAAGDEVWVAAGMYYPSYKTDVNNELSRTFLLKEGVRLYGGFAGTEKSITERVLSDSPWYKNGKTEPWEFLNETCLSGDIDGIQDDWAKITVSNDWMWKYSANLEKNSKVVVTSPEGARNETLLDGFIVTGAYENGIIAQEKTIIQNCMVIFNLGGIHSNGSLIINSYIANNQSLRGGGIYNNKGIVENCTIENNNANYGSSTLTAGYGGGIYNFEGEIINCVIKNNHARTYHSGYAYTSAHARAEGGGIYNDNGKVDRCLIMNNSVYCVSYISGGAYRNAYAYGGGILNQNGGTISNCCVTNNKIYASSSYATGGSTGGGLCNTSIGIVYNSTVINNVKYPAPGAGSYITNDYYQADNSFSYNCITETTDIGQHFVLPTSFTGIANNEGQSAELLQANWSLKPGSKYIDAGTTDKLPGWILTGTDLAGNPRINNGKIDMGAYEYSTQSTGINHLRQNNFTVFPNPADDFINISGLQLNESIYIFNMNGQIVLTYTATGKDEKLSVGHFPSGIYFVYVANRPTVKWIKK